MAKLAVIFGLALFGSVALAASGGHGDGHIPWDSLLKQVLNFLLMVGLLTYLLKSKVGAFFRNRAESFESLLVVARRAKEDAETQRQEMKARLQKLETGAQESVERARKEADELRKKLQAEAEALAAQIRAEAKSSAEREIERAKHELKEEVLTQTMSASRDQLRTAVKEQDQKRLQNEFVEKIQAVR